MNTRRFVSSVALAAAGLLLSAAVPSAESRVPAISIVVYKDPDCGCCKNWVEHLRKHGFAVTVHDTSDVSGAKETGRVPEQLRTCHTAFVNGYVVEGHVPAEDIQRMLDQKPKIAGI